jgi:hypothetical protein
MGNYIGNGENAFCGGRSKQPPAKMTLVLAGRLPASTKGHFYWLKVAGGCRARQQKPVLAARTNRFWPSERTVHV